MISRFAPAAVPLVLTIGCLPYTVGTAAQTVPAGETTRTGIVYYIPDAIDLKHDSIAGPIRGTDLEIRYGLDDKSDLGFRVPAYSGAVFTYKRRLAGMSDPDSAAVAFMAGGGFVNWGEHAETELTFMASGRPVGDVLTPYGGLRIMQVIPMAHSAVHDTPTAGGYVGMRLHMGDMDVSPELGVYYDKSALGLRPTNYIIVPGVSLTRRSARALHRATRLDKTKDPPRF
jgi:hypothetical protein